MIDFHCHILPEFDDGAKNVEMSLEMLKEEKRQGIDIVCATSHYYATKESPSHFLKRREASFNKLKEQLTSDLPQIRLGAEVQYFEGMSNVEELEKLRIEGTKLLLIEMPFSKWTSRMISEVININKKPNFVVIFAHIERYLEYNDICVFEELAQSGLLLQSNAEFFTGLLQKGKALRLTNEGIVSILGSDSHNTTSRKPNLEIAYKAITKKLGKEKLEKMNEFMEVLLNS